MQADQIRFGDRSDRRAVEEGLDFAPKFDAAGLITAIAVDHATGEVLMVAYMNEEALRRTLEIGEAVYWSRSRSELWHKGATSGHVQKVKDMLVDCDQDALVLRVEQTGAGCCHVGYRTCFFRRVADPRPPDGAPARLAPAAGGKSYDPGAVYGRS